MDTSIVGKIQFFFSHSIKGIIRNKRRYMLFAVILFTASFIVIGVFLLSNSASTFISKNKIPIQDIQFSEDWFVRLEIDNTYLQRVESIYYFSNILMLIFGFLGIVTLIFVTLLLLNERIYEIGILFSIGIGKTYIFFSFLFETIVFILIMIISGMIFAKGILEFMFTLDILPDLRDYIVFNYVFITIILIIALIFIIIPSLILLFKITTASPLKLLRQ